MYARWPLTLLLCLLFACSQIQSDAQEVSPPESGPQETANRLIHESSPYLLLHAHNPVDWYPWGEEAIDKAKKEDKPIFLSVGYSTCYWCHVMEREIFSNPVIAKLMNDWFVNIKVDREERPDLDEIYMTATQLMRQSGGWPNSLFLTPDLEPFFAGTYFPPEDRAGMPGFPTVLRRVHDGWLSQREEIEGSAHKVAELMRNTLADKSGQTNGLPTRQDVEKAVETLVSRFDEDYGGFGGGPKFPSPANLYLLWDRAERGDGEARRMVVETLRKMGQGAIYDQIGGGFHRYTLDEKWRIPHFEKMLYDNAHLAELLAVVAKATKDPELERWARGTLEFTLREMRLDNGAFKSAIDAETDGKEGAYYVWTAEELREELGENGFELLGPIFGFDASPNFEEDHYTLYLTAPFNEHAKRLGVTRRELLAKLEPLLAKLLGARSKRKYPLVDDKVLTDWNGMMIAAMARAGQALDETRYMNAARGAASFVLANLRAGDGTLQHTWRNGKTKIPAFMDDYAFLIQGLAALYDASGEKRWLDEAERLAEEMERRLVDPEGGYTFSEARPDLLFQPRRLSDGAVPSGAGVTILNLLDLAERTGRSVYRQRAEVCLRASALDLRQFPAAHRTVALAVTRFHSGPLTAATPTASESESQPVHQLAEDVLTANGQVIGPVLDDGWRPFELQIAIREGWHVNANPASLEALIPTRIQGKTRNVRYPDGDKLKFGFSEDELSVYRGEVVIPGEVGPGDHQLTLIYQACDDRRCLPAVEKTVELRR